MRLAAVAGSLRAGSYNRALLRALAEVLPPGWSLTPLEIGALPLYDGDAEAAGMPAAVDALKGALRASEALVIATPEYNHGIPGGLKNALDWLSRPGPAREVPLRGLPVGLLGASTGVVGTARAQLQLRQVLANTGAQVLPRPEVLVGQAAQKFDAEGRLTDEPTRAILRQFLEALGAWAPRVRGFA